MTAPLTPSQQAAIRAEKAAEAQHQKEVAAKTASHAAVINEEKRAETAFRQEQQQAARARAVVTRAPVPPPAPDRKTSVPRFNREGVLLNPEQCRVSSDGVVTGRGAPRKVA